MAAFDYNILVTGDCQSNSSGAISILPFGGTPPYTVEWVVPSLGADIVTNQPSLRTGLSSSTYGVRINDSTLPINLEFYVNIPVSNGVCSLIDEVVNTTCGENNGEVTVSSSSDYSSTNFYLYTIDDEFIISATTDTESYTFVGLSGGTYYVVAEDLGGCDGISATFTIEDSVDMDYELYVVPNSSCSGTPSGKIFVTNLIGQPPFTYNWSNGKTTSSITGLTAGSYSVEVIDANGCRKSKTGTVENIDPIGFGFFSADTPTCLSSNGQLTLTITGGTPPYYYSASTGNFEVSYSKSFTLYNVGPGQYNFLVTDAGLCTIQVGTTLTSPQGISSVLVTTTNSSCSSVDGKITVVVNGGSTPYVYTLVYPDSEEIVLTSYESTQVFENLTTGEYTIYVEDQSGCNYSQEVSIIAESKFELTIDTTGTTCNNANGSLSVNVSEGYELPLTYNLDGSNVLVDSGLVEVLFTNLSQGSHTIKVTDSTGCSVSESFTIEGSNPLIFSLYSTSCGTGNQGTLTAFISSGEPPFTFDWSDNVQGNPQEITVTGLTGGTYSLILTDFSGCSLSKSISLTCESNSLVYQTYVMGEDNFTIDSPVKCGFLQLLNKGFKNITSGETYCLLSAATFTVNVEIPSVISTGETFYTGYSLIDVPSDNLYYNTLSNLLENISGIGEVIIDSITNQITIKTDPNDDSLIGKQVIVELVIDYQISCQ
jgi:uncharacterized protein (DUF2141 family)